jgi:hypothetical protein
MQILELDRQDCQLIAADPDFCVDRGITNLILAMLYPIDSLCTQFSYKKRGGITITT